MAYPESKERDRERRMLALFRLVSPSQQQMLEELIHGLLANDDKCRDASGRANVIPIRRHP